MVIGQIVAIGSSGEWSLLAAESLGMGTSVLQMVTEFTLKKAQCCPLPASQTTSVFYPMAV